jgi:hypothetical protein
MHALAAADVLSVWERTRGQTPLEQALACLACAAPERSWRDWASVPFGRFCHALFRLRALTFGPRLSGVVNCPRCDERLEFAVECDDIADPDRELTMGESLRMDVGTHQVELRLPSAADLLAARSAGELLARCTRMRDPDIGSEIEWDPVSIAEASLRVADADPLAETTIDLTCPCCGHDWEALLDIVGYLTQEVAHEARRLLGDVHRLASAYGWREQDILALAPSRRRAYLELVGA